MRRRDRFDDYLLFLLAYFLYAALLLPVVVMASASGGTHTAEAVEFTPGPKDRPVLETVQQVWEARMTGTCTFTFDGVRYVVENLPKEYVDYSSWYVRMP